VESGIKKKKKVLHTTISERHTNTVDYYPIPRHWLSRFHFFKVCMYVGFYILGHGDSGDLLIKGKWWLWTDG
jgi:hypothetical protein